MWRQCHRNAGPLQWRMIPMLSSPSIAALRDGSARQVIVEVVAETGSTNADLLGRINRLAGPVLLVAERQTAGRGRAGRVWHADPGASLTFSLAWRFDLPMHGLVGLPLAAGVAIAEALASFDVGVRLKWPNDILLDGCKAAGILIESAPAGAGAAGGSWAVIGVGINLALGELVLSRIEHPAANLARLAGMDRNRLIGTLLNTLCAALEQFNRSRFPAFRDRWNSLHAHAGQAVVILDQGRPMHEGIAAGVDETGRLLLDTPAGRVAIMAGDISLRAREG